MDQIKNNTKSEKIWVIFSQLTYVFGTFIFLKILINNIGIYEYGSIQLLLTIVTISNQIFSGAINSGILRYHSIAKENKDEVTFYHAVKYIFILNVIMNIIIAAIIIYLLNKYIDQHSFLDYCSIILYLILTSSNNTLINIFSAARARKLVALSRFLEILLRIIFTTLLLSLEYNFVHHIFFCYSIACLLTLLMQIGCIPRIFSSNKKIQPSNTNYSKAIFSYSFPFMIWGLFTSAQLVSDRWALGFYLDNLAIANYSVMYQVGYSPIIMICGIFTTYLAPIVFQTSAVTNTYGQQKSSQNYLKQASWSILTISVFGALLALVLHKSIITVLTSTDYTSLSHLLPIVILAGGFYSIGQIIAIDLMTKFETRKILIINIAASVIITMCSIVGARFFGVTGVIWGLLLSNMSYAGMIVFVFLRNTPQEESIAIE